LCGRIAKERGKARNNEYWLREKDSKFFYNNNAKKKMNP